MSGIYGVYRYDGAPADQLWLDRMRAAMAYYGTDGGGCMTEGSVGMGHLLLKVNPEDAFEKQPLRGRRGLLACTARLDNREALLETFNLAGQDACQLSDGHLVNLAFERWGEDVCSHLEGDWALAAWDAKERRLLLARDILGYAALYYYTGNGFIAFASSMKALLALPGITKEPDPLRMAELLVSWQHDAELTAFKGFRSLVGAHAMTVSPDGQTRMWKFWSYEGREPLRYRRDDEYVEAYLEHFTRATKSCLRTQLPVAAELSGGRDSGSVVAMAAPILAGQGRELTAYTSVPWLPADGARNHQLGNEWDFAHATATMAGVNVSHIPIDSQKCGIIEAIEHFIDIHDGPCRNSGNQFWGKSILEACASRGAGALLCGQMGNATVSWSGNGSALLALLQGHYATAGRLLFRADPNSWLALKRQILKPAIMPARRLIRHRKAPHPWQSYSALNPQMAKELDLDRRMEAAGHDPTYTLTPLDDVRNLIFRVHDGADTSLMSETGARYSLARLDPTANLRLVEFLLRVPDDQFARKGERSFLMKRALRNRLPDRVLNVTRKGLQSADIGHRIVRELPAFRECLSSLVSVPEAREILDLPLLQRCLADLIDNVTPQTTERAVTILVRGVGVGLFLHRLARPAEAFS